MTQVKDSSYPIYQSIRPARNVGARIIRRLIEGIEHGRLTVLLPDGSVVDKAGPHDGPDATIIVKRWRMLPKITVSGDIGFAEAYLDGDWTSPDLTAVIRLAARNAESLAPAIAGSRLMRLANRLLHLLRPNSRKGARKNIEAHYDLGNDFYRLWLDPSMLYSSAIWTPQTGTLEQAQRHRLDRITQKLSLSGGEKILEIGCGWGALAAHLAVEADTHVTGITLSPSQLDFARDVAAGCGKGENIVLRIQDYRDVEETYDRIVSIEMFEAVGEAYWSTYFDTIRRSLKPGGSALLQIITIEEKRFAAYRDNVDFIQRYIFPGGFLPSETALIAAIEKSGLVLSGKEHFGGSYALTLADWRSRFRAAWPDIAALGFDHRFRRLWEYYLCYCEAGFAEGSINVGFYSVQKVDA